MNRLSLNTATCKHLTLAECIELVAEAGLEAISPWRDRVHQIGLPRAARLIRDAGLRVSSLCRGGFLTPTTPGGIAAALRDNRHAIDEAAELGARELVMVVGGLPCSFESMGIDHTESDSHDKDLVAARARVVDRLAELVPYALSAGVRLALEPMHPLFTADRGVLTTLDQALQIAEKFPPDTVGVVVDTYHVWWDPRLDQAIARAGRQGRISSYQICDWTLPLAPTSLNSRGMMGDGYIDFPAITRLVAQAGYTGDVEVEIFNETIWSQPGDVTLATMSQRYAELVEPWL